MSYPTSDGGIVITPHDIYGWVERASQEPDLSPEIRQGDWVRLTDHYGPAWRGAHVSGVRDGLLYLAFGHRETPEFFRLHGSGAPVTEADVVEHWRKVETVSQEMTTTSDGRPFHVISVEDEWRQIR